MGRNSQGVFTPPSNVNPVVTGTVITAEWANTSVNDISQGITESLDRQGRGGMLSPLKLADGTLPAPGITFGNESSSGFARLSAGAFSAVVQGVNVWEITSQTFDFYGDTFTVDGIATFDTIRCTNAPIVPTDLVTKAYADNLAFSAVLPAQAGQDYKIIKTIAGVAQWADLDGAPIPLTSAATLQLRRSYMIDSTGGGFSLALPALVEGAWIKVTDVGGKLTDFPVNMQRGASLIEGFAEDCSLNVNYDSFTIVGTLTRGWVFTT
jgi:hypothetical protein